MGVRGGPLLLIAFQSKAPGIFALFLFKRGCVFRWTCNSRKWVVAIEKSQTMIQWVGLLGVFVPPCLSLLAFL
jgi:hypothetical protein